MTPKIWFWSIKVRLSSRFTAECLWQHSPVNLDKRPWLRLNDAQIIIFVNRGPIGLDDLYRLKKIVNWNFGFDLRWNARFPSDRFEKRPISTPDVPVNRVNGHQIGKSIFFGKSVEPPDLTRIYDWPRKKVELKTSASMYLPIQNLSTPCTSQQPLYHRNAPRFQ